MQTIARGTLAAQNPNACRMVYLSEQPPHEPYQLFSSLPDVMPCKDAAKALGICEKKIREMARTGELQGIKIGSAWRFPKTSLINYVNGGGNGAA